MEQKEKKRLTISIIVAFLFVIITAARDYNPYRFGLASEYKDPNKVSYMLVGMSSADAEKTLNPGLDFSIGMYLWIKWWNPNI